MAKTIGLPFAPSEEAAQVALAIVLELPNGPERLKPGAAFAPGEDPGSDKSAFERVIGILGRDPNWTASQASANQRRIHQVGWASLTPRY